MNERLHFGDCTPHCPSYCSPSQPGVSLRIIDSYVVTGTTNGTVNWTVVDATLSQAVDNFIASGMFKVPGLTTTARLKAFVNSLAHIIYDYKVSTGRKSL
jgi:hypothetical protein